MKKELDDVFKVANDYIRKERSEIDEMQKLIDKKVEKMKSLQKTLIIMKEHLRNA